MKYMVILIDGAADENVEALGNKTPLMVAKMPNIEKLSKTGQIGLVQTVPEGMSPGSDVANLSIMGYEPEKYHTGRSPLEALSAGVEMKDTDVAIRLNLVTLGDEESFSEKTIIDYSGGEIETVESIQLINALKEAFDKSPYHIYPGISYRHVFIWENGSVNVEMVPPHNILDKKIGSYLPKGDNEAFFRDFIEKGYELLKNHPINLARVKRGLKPANAPWLWGEGKKPLLDKFSEKNNLKGGVISAVDLIKGIGMGANMTVIEAPDVTGTIDTNFTGKSEAALEGLLNGLDYVYVHLEAPDECGHQGDVAGKVRSLELIDEKIIGPILKGLEEANEDFRMLVVPDHRTPLNKRTHTMDPVPYLIFDSRKALGNGNLYDEEHAKSGVFVSTGPKLHDILIEKSDQ
ncbi:phosphoglycerate mutase [endosymbiont 'TC1' of Trimyema compressum]|uniref:cofactor-independent phosphoglycerate mutase n=1 Tax=endosymbiont 'TC1' of Trimyema compressum TaxID=243899 RepID=UPI0007F0E217|nr:cofactor-independent phosphoglycerate mutase [endosymbiont 'TC1' of Trimyema compressum]AMP19799.1 phosphoglycerate mutase [endosymbiont 'TC1' of Trimyema compressum]